MRMLLTHQSGLPAIAKPMEPGIHLTSWETMIHALEEQEPWWAPGTKHGYHVNTMGFLVGEVVRRVTGRRIRDVIAEDVARPLDAGEARRSGSGGHCEVNTDCTGAG